MLVRKPARFVERNRPTDRLGGTTTMKPTHLRLDAAVSCSIASAILVPNHGDAVQVRGPRGRFAPVVGQFRAVGWDSPGSQLSIFF
jgi:hypothetical protein